MDNTYKNIFQSKVLPELWLICWQRWKRKFLSLVDHDVRFILLFHYLFQEMNLTQDPSTLSTYQRSYVPSEIYIKSDYRNMEYYNSTLDIDREFFSIADIEQLSEDPLFVRIILYQSWINLGYEVYIGKESNTWFRNDFLIGDVVYRENEYLIKSL